MIPFSFRNEPVAAICSRMLNEVKSRAAGLYACSRNLKVAATGNRLKWN